MISFAGFFAIYVMQLIIFPSIFIFSDRYQSGPMPVHMGDCVD